MDRMKVDEMVKERAQLDELVRGILDKADAERRAVTGTEKGLIDKADARISEIRVALGQTGSSDWGTRGRQTSLSITGDPESREADMALRAWALGRNARPEHIAAAEKLGLRWQAADLETRALSIGTTTAGGNAVGDEMIRSFVEVAKWYGRVQSVATVLSTTTGAALPIPTIDDSSSTGRLLAEATGATTTTDPSFGQVVLSSYKMSSDAVIVSEELIQDSSIPLAAYLGSALGTRVGRIKNTYFTTGTGSGQPGGVQVKASLGKTASATNAITLDECVDLYHALDPAYRMSPSTAFMMSDPVAAYIRKLKDSNGVYLWQTSVTQGQPDRLFGMPVIINPDMDSTFATNKRLVLFGDFSKYFIRECAPLFRRSDDVYFLAHQSVFEASQRVDGNLIDTTSVKYLRTA